MRALLAVLLALAALCSAAPAAQAACVGPQISVSPASPAPGETVTVRGEYFGTDCYDTGPPPEGLGVLGKPASGIEVVLRHRDGETVLARGGAASDYTFEVTLPLPSVRAGEASVEARYDASTLDRLLASADVQVTGGGEAPATWAPVTFGPAAGAEEPPRPAADVPSVGGQDVGGPDVGGPGVASWVGAVLVALATAVALWWWRALRRQRRR